MDRKVYLSIMAAVATTAGIAIFVLLMAPIAKAIGLALILGVSTLPYHAWIAGRMPGRPNGAAGLMVLTITVCFILPLTALIITIAENANDLYAEIEHALRMLSSSSLPDRFPFLGRLLSLGNRLGISLAQAGEKIAAGASSALVTMATETAKNLAAFLFTLAVALFITFFIYRDGERIMSSCLARVSGDAGTVRRLLAETRSIITTVMIGTIFTCFIQGLTAGIGYFFAGTPAPILCGALTAIAALVPVVGTGVIWVPLVCFLVIKGAFFAAIMLAIWSMVMVGLADNAIRPLLIGAANINIPVPAVVLGAIGGLYAMGLIGLFLGPIILAVLGMLRREFFPDACRYDQPR